MIPQTTCPSSTNSGVNTTKLLFVTGTKYCHDHRWILRHDRVNHLQRSQTQCRLKWQYTFAYRPWRSRKQDGTFSLMPTPSCIVLICTDICQNIPSILVLYTTSLSQVQLQSLFYSALTQLHHTEFHLSRHCSIINFVDPLLHFLSTLAWCCEVLLSLEPMFSILYFVFGTESLGLRLSSFPGLLPPIFDSFTVCKNKKCTLAHWLNWVLSTVEKD